MKRYSVIVIHDNYKRIKNITARNNKDGELITLLRDNIRPYEYDTFQELYKSVLNICKNNNMRISYAEIFGGRFYDIQFINASNPAEVEQFGYKGI